MAPSHAIREKINAIVRERLIRDGVVRGPSFLTERLVSRGYTNPEKSLAANYAPGDVVAFHRPYKRLGVEKGDELRVAGVDHANGAVNLFVSGVMTPEALAAARSMEAEGVYVNVFVLTSADRIYAEHKKAKKEGRPSRLEMMVGDEHRDNAVVSVLDGHSLALSFLGGALGADQRCLGTDQFGQSGLPHEVYDALQIGQTHIEDACREVVG